MSRPSLQSERKKQVLLAYVNAAAKQGVSSTTLEIIAEEADLSRSLIRHHLGNKDEMFDALVEYVVDEFNQQTQLLASVVPEKDGVKTLFDLLFDNAKNVDISDHQLTFVFAELTMQSVSNELLAKRLNVCISEFEVLITNIIEKEFAGNSKTRTRTVAYGIMAIYFNFISLAPFKPDASIARAASELMIESLNTSHRKEATK